MPHILAIDQGTTSTRAVVFDAQDARPVASAQVELRQIFPQPGWVEHDPEEIFQAAVSVAREAIEKARASGLTGASPFPSPIEGDGSNGSAPDSSSRRLTRNDGHGIEIAAIGITNQRETTVLWERATGRAVANAIVWQCRRTADICRAMRDRNLSGDIRSRTGLVIDPYFSATKLRWLLDGGPSGWPDRVRGKSDFQRMAEDGELCFGTVDSWLLYRLTMGGVATPHPNPLPQGERGLGAASNTPTNAGRGQPSLTRTLSRGERASGAARAVHATDATNASRTMLLNLHDLQWDPALLSLFDIPEAMLPEVRPSAGDFGVTAPDVFGEEIPITGIAGDQHAALYGQACFEPGMAKCTYGTGAFVLSVTGSRPAIPSARPGGRTSPAAKGVGRAGPDTDVDPRPDPLPLRDGVRGNQAPDDHGLLVTLGWQAGSKRAYAIEGSVFTSGAAVQWLRDGLGVIQHASETERLAESLDGNDGVYLVPAFSGLGAPYWDAGARGLLIGMTRGTTHAHLARAALEATAYQVREVVVAMDEAARRRGTSATLRADGGQTANAFLMQFQADILDRPIEVSAAAESSALGAALLAGRGAGIWDSEREVAAIWQLGRRYEPQMSASRRIGLLAGWNDAVRRSRVMGR